MTTDQSIFGAREQAPGAATRRFFNSVPNIGISAAKVSDFMHSSGRPPGLSSTPETPKNNKLSARFSLHCGKTVPIAR